MAGPSPHVPLPPLVPHLVPPLSSSSSFPALSSSKPRSETLSSSLFGSSAPPSQPLSRSEPSPPPPPPPIPSLPSAAFPALPSSSLTPSQNPLFSPNLLSYPQILIPSSSGVPPSSAIVTAPAPIFSSATHNAFSAASVSPSSGFAQFPTSIHPPSASPTPHPSSSLQIPPISSSSSPASSALAVGTAPPCQSYAQVTRSLPSSSFQIPPFASAPGSSAQTAGPAPPRQSYSQVTRSPRGPGFVRGHANDVEAFARIPRTGAHVICGTREGMPSFSFAKADLPKIEELYSNALVMRFLGGRPSLEASHKEIVEWGVDHPFSIGPLSSRAFLLRFQNDEDLLKVLTRPSSLIKNFPYKIFRWHNQCHRQADSCSVPVWISLPRLPLQCFIPEFLETVANKIGRFLCFDKATTTLARPSATRLCVEIDLRKPPPQSIWVGLFEGFKQPIIYERLPKFCSGCCMIGHATTECSKYVPEPRQHVVTDRIPNRMNRTPAVRQYVVLESSSVQQRQPLLERPLAPQELGPHPHPVAAAHPSPQSIPPPPTSTTPSPSEALFQVQPAASILQRTAATTTPAHAHPQDQSAAALLQHTPATAEPSDVHHQAVVAQPTDHNLADNSDGSLLSGVILDDTNACMTDLINQQPPFPNVEVIQAEKLPCPPGVCDNADTSDKAKSIDPDSINIRDKALSVPPTPVYEPQQVLEQHQLVSGTTSAHTEKVAAENSSVVVPILHQTSAAKTTNQLAALERFKRKVGNLAQLQGQQPIGVSSVNPFDALQDVQSDDDDGSDSVPSDHSDSDGGFVEPLNMGYQSGDGRSSTICKTSSSAHTGRKINKRHPNIPLNVRLRARKSTYPSTP